MCPASRPAAIGAYSQEFLEACGLGTAGPEVLRAAKRMAIIAAAGEIAIDWEILPWERGAAIDGVATCFNAWRKSRGGDAVAHDDARAIEQVRGFIERYGPSKFEDLSATNRQNNYRIHDRAGWRRKESKKSGAEYLFFPQFFKTEVCKDFAALREFLAGRRASQRVTAQNP